MRPLHLFGAATIVAIGVVVAAAVASGGGDDGTQTATSVSTTTTSTSTTTTTAAPPLIVRVVPEAAHQVGDEIEVTLRGVEAGSLATLEVGGEVVAESTGSGSLSWTPSEAGAFDLAVFIDGDPATADSIGVRVTEKEELPVPTTSRVGLPETPSALDNVADRGYLICGVSGRGLGFSETLADGSTIGLDADVCRAIAAAITGDASNVEFVNLEPSQRFAAMASGLVDIVSRNTVVTARRDGELGIDFGPVVFYDGTHFMGRVGDGFATTSDYSSLDGKTVCTFANSTIETAVLQLSNQQQLSIDLSTFESFDEPIEAFADGRCDAVAHDLTGLLRWRSDLNPTGDWVTFPERPLELEPMAPFFRENDSRFAAAVDWTLNAMFFAAERDISSANVDEISAEELTFALRFLLGDDADQVSNFMGLPADAFFQVISQVGNYNEMFDRNFGPLGLTREGSLNTVWSEGGLLSSPPMR